MKKVPEGTRMCAQFTHQSVATSGKSADGATEIHVQRITAKGSVTAPPQCVHTEEASPGTKKRYLARLGPHTGDPVRCADVFTAINTYEYVLKGSSV